jgi:hypothetical protein
MTNAHDQIKKLQELELLLKKAAEESRAARWLISEEAFLEARRVLIAAVEKVEQEAARARLQAELGFSART